MQVGILLNMEFWTLAWELLGQCKKMRDLLDAILVFKNTITLSNSIQVASDNFSFFLITNLVKLWVVKCQKADIM